jgi:hypothetical protein
MAEVSPPLSWLVRNWKLKVVAVVLALILLLAVAFSENPLSIRQYSALVRHTDPPLGLVVMKPPSRVTITVSGLSSAVRTLNDSNAYVTVDLSRLKIGPSQKVDAQPTVLVNGISIQGGPVPLSLDVKELKTQSLDVQVRPKESANFRIVPDQTYGYCDNPAEACKVTLSAPANYFDNLVAYVEVPGTVTNGFTTIPNLPIKFSQSGTAVDFASLNTFPKPGVLPSLMPYVRVTAVSSVSTKPVALRPRLAGSGQQACGFVLTGVTINPGGGVASVTGPTTEVSKSPDAIDLPPVDITGANTSVTRTFTVPLTDSKLQADPARVNVTAVLQKQFDCAAPTPPPTPTPTPTTTPPRPP